MDFDEFLQDSRTINAVVLKLTIIGEAAVHVPESVCTKWPDVPSEKLALFTDKF